jgi:quercetin dioxygenase-like cupin family protein
VDAQVGERQSLRRFYSNLLRSKRLENLEVIMGDVQLLTFDDIPEEVFTRWDITGHQVNQHLLSGSLTGTPEIVADLFTFPPGFIHHMHRHPYADMILVPLSGTLQFVGEFARMLEIRSGQVFVVPRGAWHEFRNVSDKPSRVLHFFSGVGAIEDIGYQAHPDQFSATR